MSGPERLEDLGIVIVDAVVALEPWRRRHHDAGGARDHDLVRQPPHVLEAGMAHAHDHLAVAGARPITRFTTDERLVGGELVRLAHHAEQGEAMDAAAQIEVGQRVDALQVERALVGERRGGDDVDAFGGFA